MVPEKKLKLSKEKYLMGVCGGIADWFNINPTFCRFLWAFLTLITFFLPGILVYIVLSFTMESPDE